MTASTVAGMEFGTPYSSAIPLISAPRGAVDYANPKPEPRWVLVDRVSLPESDDLGDVPVTCPHCGLAFLFVVAVCPECNRQEDTTQMCPCGWRFTVEVDADMLKVERPE